MKKNPDWKLFAILGFPLAHTLSPQMQEAAFRARGIKAFYLALGLRENLIRRVLKHLRRSPFQGFNVTVPYKELVLRYVDKLTPQARAVKAANTLIRKGNQWVGHNTDVAGFLISLKKDAGMNPAGKNVFIFGAGGGARAVAYALCQSHARQIVVCNRNAGRGRSLVREYQKLFPKIKLLFVPMNSLAIQRLLPQADLVVNATSLGLKAKDASPLKPSWIPERKASKPMIFYDLIYNPPVTPFLKAAKHKGHKAVNGRGMLLHQGALAWQCWTGKKPPVDVMRKALESALQTSGRKKS